MVTKKFSTQTEYSCYIQIHRKKKEKLYLITNFKKNQQCVEKTNTYIPRWNYAIKYKRK